MSGRGRPKMKWKNKIESDIRQVGVSKKDQEDIVECKTGWSTSHSRERKQRRRNRKGK